MIYKVSYVVSGGDYPGGIKNETERPQVGAVVQIGRMKFEVTEVHEIIPRVMTSSSFMRPSNRWKPPKNRVIDDRA